jgi:ribosomal protein L22
LRIGEIEMPKWGYTIIQETLNPEKTAKASGRELKVSHKAAREFAVLLGV